MIKVFLPKIIFVGLFLALYYTIPNDQLFWLVIICPASYFLIDWTFSKLLK